MSWIYDNIRALMADALSDMAAYFSTLISGFFSLDATNATIKAVDGAVAASTALAIVLAVIVGAKHLISSYIMETEDAGDSVSDFLFRLACSCAAIATFGIIGKELINYASLVAEDIIGVSSYVFPGEAYNPSNMETQGLAALLMLLVYLIGLVIFSMIAVMRAGTLAIYHVVAPIFCLNLISVNRELWHNFLTAYLGTVFYYIIQLLCFTLSQAAMGQETVYGAVNTGSAVAFLLLAITAPQALDRIVFTSGIKRGLGGLARMAGTAAAVLRR